jgi:hypothetical protein
MDLRDFLKVLMVRVLEKEQESPMVFPGNLVIEVVLADYCIRHRIKITKQLLEVMYNKKECRFVLTYTLPKGPLTL